MGVTEVISTMHTCCIMHDVHSILMLEGATGMATLADADSE